MKMSREQLKLLVKECLLEILSEGLGSATQVPQVLKRQGVVEALRARPRSSSLDQPIRKQSDALKQAVIMESGGNATMAAILADTAATTLPQMLANDRPGAPLPPVGVVERAVANSTPEELFGEETSSRWANLAFSDPSPKKSA